MKTVREVSALTGVSVRTLHHYDAIGLLPPAAVTEAGYRLYDDASLERLRSILFFRELRFSLREIKTMLDSPDYDPDEALARQITMLEAQYERTGQVLALARQLQNKGELTMDFHAFDEKELASYREEARERWGGTEAYRESEARAAQRDENACAQELMECFAALGALRTLPADDPAVQEAVAALRDCISAHYYPCTDEILAGLGQMYTADPRFRENIDAAGGEGTAEFAGRAIAAFCGK